MNIKDDNFKMPTYNLFTKRSFEPKVPNEDRRDEDILDIDRCIFGHINCKETDNEFFEEKEKQYEEENKALPINTFAFTVKKRYKKGEVVTDKDYVSFFNIFKKKGITIDYKVAEVDKLGILHYHGRFTAPKGINIKHAIKHPRYSIRNKIIFDEMGWIRYCTKCAPNKKLF